MGKASDIWALGCLTACLLSGKTMEDRDREKQPILGRQAPEDVAVFVEEVLEGASATNHKIANLLRHMLKVNHQERITAEEICNKY